MHALSLVLAALFIAAILVLAWALGRSAALADAAVTYTVTRQPTAVRDGHLLHIAVEGGTDDEIADALIALTGRECAGGVA